MSLKQNDIVREALREAKAEEHAQKVADRMLKEQLNPLRQFDGKEQGDK